MKKNKIFVISLAVILSTIKFINCQETIYRLYDNLMHSYSFKLSKNKGEKSVTFQLMNLYEKNERKSIFIHCDAENIKTEAHPGNRTQREEYKEYIQSNYPIYAFQLIKDADEYDQITININSTNIEDQSLIIRVQTTDEGIVILKGERQHRIFNIIFSYYSNSPFYIISMAETPEKNKAKLLVDQLIGKFPLRILDHPEDSHLLPEDSDKPNNLENDYILNLNTSYEIIHILPGMNGEANFYYIPVFKDGFIMPISGKKLFYIKQDTIEILMPDVSIGKKVNYEIKGLYGNLKIEVYGNYDIEPKSFEINGTNKEIIYDSTNAKTLDSKFYFKCSSEEEAAFSIVTVLEDYNNIIIDNSIEDKAVNYERFIINLPRNKFEGKSSMKLRIFVESQEEEEDLLFTNEFSGFTKENTNFKYVPDPDYSCNYNYYVNLDGDLLITMTSINPYDKYINSDDEVYFMSFKVDKTKNPIIPFYKIRIEYKDKNFEQYDSFIKGSPDTIIFVDDKNIIPVVTQPPLDKKPTYFTLLIQSCSFYKSTDKENKNSAKITYYDEENSIETNLDYEYQVYNYLYSFRETAVNIIEKIDKLQYSGYIISYHFYNDEDSEDIIEANDYMKKILNLRSKKYLFTQSNDYISWNCINSDSDDIDISVQTINYQICGLDNEQTEIDYYKMNLCYMQKKVEEYNNCIITNNTKVNIADLPKYAHYAVFHEVKLPLVAKFFIGSFEINASGIGRRIGNYVELVDKTNIKLTTTETYLNIFIEVSDFSDTDLGMVVIQTTSEEAANDLATNIVLTKSSCQMDTVLTEDDLKNCEAEGDIDYVSANSFKEYVEILLSNKKAQNENNNLTNNTFIFIGINGLKTEVSINCQKKFDNKMINNNLMQDYIFVVNKKKIPYYITFTIDKISFTSNKKSILLYTEALEIVNTTYLSFTINTENFYNSFDYNNYIQYYENLKLIGFQFDVSEDETGMKTYSGDCIVIRFIPNYNYQEVNIKVQASDEAINFITDEQRIDRLMQVIFIYGYYEPFFIVSSFKKNIEGKGYIDQVQGKFSIDTLSQIRTHLFPLEGENQFEPLKNHFITTSCEFSIIHIKMIKPGLANFYTIINEEKTTLLKVNAANYLYIDANIEKNVQIPDLTLGYLKIQKITGYNKINIKYGDVSIQLTDENPVSYKTITKSELMTINSENEAAVSITLTVDTMTLIQPEFNEMGYNVTINEKRFIIKFPRGDYSNVGLFIDGIDQNSIKFCYSLGIEDIDKSYWIVDPKYSNDYTNINSGKEMEAKNFKKQFINPYDQYDFNKETSMYYISFTINSKEEFKTYIELTYIKNQVINNVLHRNKFEFVKFQEQQGEQSIKYLLGLEEENIPKPKFFIIMTHICDFVGQSFSNKLKLNYLESNLWENIIMDSYEFHVLPFSVKGIDLDIYNTGLSLEGGNNIILSYYYYDFETDESTYTDDDQLKKINDRMLSKRYNIYIDYEEKTLNWNLLNDKGEEEIYEKVYEVCVYPKDYLTNSFSECTLEQIKDQVNCTELKYNKYLLDQSFKERILAIYELIYVPIKARYFIGTIKYLNKKEEEEEEEIKIGNFYELKENTIKHLNNEGNTNYYYINLENFTDNNEGIIVLKNSLTCIIKAKIGEYQDKLYSESQLTEILYNGQDAVIYKDTKEGISEIIFEKIINVKSALAIEITEEKGKDTFISFRGEIKTYNIDKNELFYKTVEYKQVGFPIYFHFKITKFTGDKKGVVLQTDNDESIGTHVVMPHKYGLRGTSEIVDYDPEFIDYPLSAFKLRNSESIQNGDSVTIRLIPKVKDTYVYIRFQATDLGVVIWRGERNSRTFRVVFDYTYTQPFYLILAHPFNVTNKYGYLYIDQITGLFEIYHLSDEGQTHLFPIDEDNHFTPINYHYLPLPSLYTIIYVKQLLPGYSNFYYIADNGLGEINIQKNTEEFIYIAPYCNIKVNFDQSTTYRLSFKYISSNEGQPININIPNIETISLSSSNPVYYTKKEYNGKSITINSNIEGFVSLTSTDINFSNEYTIIDFNNPQNDKEYNTKSNKYFIMQFPKNNDYAGISIEIKPKDETKNLYTHSVVLKTTEDIQTDSQVIKGYEYLPDPELSTIKLASGNEAEAMLSYSIGNPYNLEGILSNEMAYLSTKIKNEDNFIFYYKINIIKFDENTEAKIKNNEIYLVNNFDEITRFQKEATYLEELSPKPLGFIVFIHSCKFEKSKQNKLFLNYLGKSMWNETISSEYELFNLASMYQHMNILIQINEMIPDNTNGFIASYYLYSKEQITYDRNKDEFLEKINYLASEPYVFLKQGNYIYWFGMNRYSSSSSIIVKNIKFFIYQIPNSENKDLSSNDCYVQSKYSNNLKKSIENRININDVKEDHFLSIFKEAELPFKIRAFVGYYFPDSYVENNEENNEANNYSYKGFILAIAILAVLLILGIVSLIILCIKRQKQIDITEINKMSLIRDN